MQLRQGGLHAPSATHEMPPQRPCPPDDEVLQLLSTFEPRHKGWRRAWALAKLLLACVTLVPIRVAALLVLLSLMCIVSFAALLFGCGSCYRGRPATLSARPKNCAQRAVLGLISPLCRMSLFALGFIYIIERRTEFDGVTPRLRKRCWQCGPSPRGKATAAAAAAVASAVAARAGSKGRPGASVPSPKRALPGDSDNLRLRVDSFAAAAGATIVANHTSIADVLYIGWRFPATAVASDFLKLVPCFW
jgi:hypothetical protein